MRRLHRFGELLKGDLLKCLHDFPEDARHDAGYQLDPID
jgi:hypothetical protein